MVKAKEEIDMKEDRMWPEPLYVLYNPDKDLFGYWRCYPQMGGNHLHQILTKNMKSNPDLISEADIPFFKSELKEGRIKLNGFKLYEYSGEIGKEVA